jgi:hypothetical protein
MGEGLSLEEIHDAVQAEFVNLECRNSGTNQFAEGIFQRS